MVIAVRDIERARDSYAELLGGAPSEISVRDGAAISTLRTANVGVELMAPDGAGEVAERLRAALDQSGEGLKSLVFAVDDIETAHRRAARVGLAPQSIMERETYRLLRLDTQRTGVRIFLIAREGEDVSAPAREVLGLDHVVVRAGDIERAAALYGARLGLDLRLDREAAGRRFMFFRCGDTIIELVQDEVLAGQPDLLWGLSWRVADADAAYARLEKAGVAVSEVRPGLKPGSRVLSVRDSTGNVPTLLVETSPNRR